ncbi:MAG: hypothetical protein IJX74_03145 [Clostridia bacterium]|nr:hypothetical protein [Clostridia bacterium]
MPIGKDSIQKRVAKTAPEAKTEVVTEKVTPPAETKPATAKKTSATTKKTTTSTAKKSTSSAAKKPAAKKPATAKKVVESTAVIANISPEVVEKVTGHKEGAQPTVIGIGKKLPVHLL